MITLRKSEAGLEIVDARYHADGQEYSAVAVLNAHFSDCLKDALEQLEQAHKRTADKIAEGKA